MLRRVEDLDEWLSKPLFESSLPPWLEAVYTVPACFFGLIPSLAVGPLWIAHMACYSVRTRAVLKDESISKQQGDKIELLRDVTYALSILFLVAWGLFLNGYTAATTKFLGKNLFYLMSYAGSIAFLFYTLLQPQAPDSDGSDAKETIGAGGHREAEILLPQIASLALYYLVLWSSSVLIVLVVKRWTRRVRPCAKNETRDRYVARKAYPSIARLLATHQSHESFPSGDATAVTALAIPMTYIRSLGVPDREEWGDPTDATFLFDWCPPWAATATTAIAFWLVILACTGRVYVLAHHVGDVVVGALVPCLLHLLFTRSPVGGVLGLGNIYAVQWYHPVIANMVTTVYALATLKRNSVPAMNGNTNETKKVV
jgi:membrane-associated phospholipid phosphatase